MACRHGPRVAPESLLSRRLHQDGFLLPFHFICKYYLDISNYYLYLLHGVKEPGLKNIGPHLLSIHAKIIHKNT